VCLKCCINYNYQILTSFTAIVYINLSRSGLKVIMPLLAICVYLKCCNDIVTVCLIVVYSSVFPSAWNSLLPDNIKLTTDTHRFKRLLKSHLFHLAFWHSVSAPGQFCKPRFTNLYLFLSSFFYRPSCRKYNVWLIDWLIDMHWR